MYDVIVNFFIDVHSIAVRKQSWNVHKCFEIVNGLSELNNFFCSKKIDLYCILKRLIETNRCNDVKNNLGFKMNLNLKVILKI